LRALSASPKMIFIDLSREGCLEPFQYFTLNSAFDDCLSILKGKTQGDPSRRI
jgi:hypothetical protein